MRILIDTNCFLMIAPKASKHHWLMNLIQIGKIELVVSTEILDEYEETMGIFYSSDYAEFILKGILNLPNVFRLNPIYFQWNLITVDVDDNKFVDAYVASNATMIITYDKHFRVLDRIAFPKVIFMNLEDFEEYWHKNKH